MTYTGKINTIKRDRYRTLPNIELICRIANFNNSFFWERDAIYRRFELRITEELG